MVVCCDLPSLYKLDADGMVYLDDARVPPELEEEAREGAAACPRRPSGLSPSPRMTKPFDGVSACRKRDNH